MAQRTVALYDGKYIGIETIFTVVDGSQINIPDKLRELRDKGRCNELFCPCGCGRNLIVVAGDKNLREQHFRIKDGISDKECQALLEGKESIDSKIVLKCWLDEKIHPDDLQTRVPICSVDDTNRKYEFSFLSWKHKTAVCYCRARENLSDEKLEILDTNSRGIQIIYVVSSSNKGCDGQYPENLMKIQKRQGYCLFLTAVDADYNIARLKSVLYVQDIDGYWQELIATAGLLKDYQINAGSIIYKGKPLELCIQETKSAFETAQHQAAVRREEERKLREKQQAEQRRLLEEQRQKQMEAMAAAEERRRLEEQKRKVEELRFRKEFDERLPTYFDQQKTPVIDPDGNRLLKCEFCGKIGKVSDFVSYGGRGKMNLGKCKDCLENNPDARVTILVRQNQKQKDPMKCPECGGRLRERNGRYGSFLGCTNYPGCKFTRKL